MHANRSYHFLDLVELRKKGYSGIQDTEDSVPDEYKPNEYGPNTGKRILHDITNVKYLK